MHQIEAFVDIRKRHGVSDHRINLNLAFHVPVDDFRNVGAAAGAAEGGAFPDATGDELEWTGRDFGPGRRGFSWRGPPRRRLLVDGECIVKWLPSVSAAMPWRRGLDNLPSGKARPSQVVTRCDRARRVSTKNFPTEAAKSFG